MKVFSNSYWTRFRADYAVIAWLFLRGLALIYFAAFASMAVQIEGLVGENGILPLTAKMQLFEQFYPNQKFWHMPTLFWLDASDAMLRSVCYAGMAASILLLLNVFTRTALIVCYVLYLSIVEAGQDFMLFQWDSFLLESGFLAIFLTWRSGIVVLLYRFLVARFMFMGGVVKLASGDPTWANLTALSFHYQTQPLPSPVAYYAHHLPEWFHKLCVGGVFFIELVVPFFVFLPRRWRLFACGAFVLLQGSIVLTGNYTFFNLLTILLCLFLLEDKDVAGLLPQRLTASIKQNSPAPGVIANSFAGVWAALVIIVCTGHLWVYHLRAPLVEPLRSLLRTAGTWSLVNNYGPFAVMTTTRNEIIVQGSNDAEHWLEYSFKYKPGKLNRPLGWNIPHQPRLDWQMWFAALGPPRPGSWFDSFLDKLLQGSPTVLLLLDGNPFPDKPPKYVRALLYRYSYTSMQQRRDSGQIWQRQYQGVYWPERRLWTIPSIKRIK